MKKPFPVLCRLVAAGIFAGLLFSGLAASLGAPGAQGAAVAFQATDYPAPFPTSTFDPSYPGPGGPTLTPSRTLPSSGQPTPTVLLITPGFETPFFEPTLGETAVPDPNLFLTEDAQIRDALVTPNAQTLQPTRTPTITITPTFTRTLPPTPGATPTPTPPPAGLDGGRIVWPLVAVGFILPMTLLSFGVLAVTVAREARRTS